MTSNLSKGAAALALAVTAMLATGEPASAHRWHGHRHGWGHHGYSYYPPYAYGPGFVYAPNYAAMLYTYAYFYRHNYP